MRSACIVRLAVASLIAGVCLGAQGEPGAAPVGGRPAAVGPEVGSFIAARCLGCHDAATREAGVSLEALGDSVTDASATGWLRALEQIERGTMPPPTEEQPAPVERQAVAIALEQAVVAHARSRPAGGATVLRRLNRTEYRRTLEDLLHLDLSRADPTVEFPEDTRVHGFASNGEKLVTSSFLMKHYLAAAKDVVDRAVHFEERPEVRTVSLLPPFNWSLEAHCQSGFDNAEAVHAKQLGQQQRYQSLVYVHGSMPMEGLRNGMPTSGRYAFRILAEAKFRHADMNPKKMGFGGAHHDPAQPHRLALTVGSLVGIDPSDRDLVRKAFTGDSFDGNLANVSAGADVLATWDVPDDEPTWLECRVWLDAGQFPRFSFQNGPTDSNYRIHNFVQDNRYTLLDKDQLAAYEASTLSGYSKRLVHFETPRIRIYRVEVTGPLEDEWPPASHRAIFGDKPYESAAAADVLQTFAARAWRRPVTGADVEPLLAIVRQQEKAAVDAGTPPQEAARAAIKLGIQGVLCDPDFLYRQERGDVLDGYEIAARLSYFLWSSMPDDGLRSRAAAGDLTKPEARRSEAERLLADPRSELFVNEFLDGWLALRKLGAMKPQGAAAGLYFDEGLEPAMRRETRLFFTRLLRINGPISDFLDSDYTFVNRGLAKLYGIDVKQMEPLLGKPVDGLAPADLRSDDAGGTPSRDFVMVKLADSRRGGLLGQASVLTLTANGVDTNPVIRGSWVLENMLGAPPAAPPPNVPVIEPDVRGTTTLRQRLEKHRDNPSCLGCHRHIDPPGFALESFDVIGRWRGSSKETTGGEFGGLAFDDITGFKAALLTMQPQFARCLVEKLLIHLLGRDLTAADRPAIRGILDETAAGGYRLRDIVLACCASDLVARK